MTKLLKGFMVARQHEFGKSIFCSNILFLGCSYWYPCSDFKLWRTEISPIRNRKYSTDFPSHIVLNCDLSWLGTRWVIIHKVCLISETDLILYGREVQHESEGGQVLR